ncbi:uncharacterized protein LOC134855398 isoform X2 [Symsagittifera roscoffensis]|uniref:uncharacterized protein LOC134855398 isoform X2 n=1 Tax=Symsagittifera roscoffensis TaxID=84072 RepID=UPI00307C5865
MIPNSRTVLLHSDNETKSDHHESQLRAVLLKCAICNAEHAVNIVDLKPMFEIRDGLKLLSPSQQDEEALWQSPQNSVKITLPFCRMHTKWEQEFWCVTCREPSCTQCVSLYHKDHNLKILKNVIDNICSSAIQRVEKLQNKVEIQALTKNIAQLKSEVAYHKYMMKLYQKKLDEVEKLVIEPKVLSADKEWVKNVKAGTLQNVKSGTFSSAFRLMKREDSKLLISEAGFRFSAQIPISNQFPHFLNDSQQLMELGGFRFSVSASIAEKTEENELKTWKADETLCWKIGTRNEEHLHNLVVKYKLLNWNDRNKSKEMKCEIKQDSVKYCSKMGAYAVCSDDFMSLQETFFYKSGWIRNDKLHLEVYIINQ